MFSMFKTKPKTTAEQKLEEIKNILFPPFAKQSKEDITFLIDYSADSNLQAVITDLEEGHNDEIMQGTINKVIDRLVEVRKILKAYGEFDTDAQYIIVDDLPTDEKDVEVGPERRH